MKAKLIIPCFEVLLVFQLIAFAQKTEVSVRQGKVVAETPTASVNIEAGRKAILSPDKNPTVTVNDPLVDDVMEIYKWVEAEKQAQRERIDGSGIQVYRIDDEQSIKCAWLFEGTNSSAQPMKEIQRGPTLILKEPKYYDMEGNIIPFDLEKIDAKSGIYTMHLSEPIQPGEQIKFIGVSEIDNAIFSKEGPLWILRLNYGSSPYNLCYYRFILPESTIFVDSSQPATMIDSVDGRVAITIRVYTGSSSNGVTIAYLWPNKDGTTIADIPPRYRGLRDPAEQEIVRAGQLEIAKILSGGTYEKQNTPLETLLSLFSAAAHKDSGQLLRLVSPNLREYVAGQMDQIMALAGWVVDYRFLGSPKWPDKPQNGYAHPVYLCREGSLICEATLVIVYQDGKWYLQGIETGRKETESTVNAESKAAGGVTISKTKPDLSTATYENLKPGQFLRNWLFLGPVDIPWKGSGYFPDEETSNKFFDTESLNLERFEPQVKIAGNDYEWAALHSEYGVIDLTAVFDKWFVVAYAWAQVEMPEQTNAVLGIGSDDCIKVWLNGKLVHEHRGGRGVVADSDHVPVTFNKGKNQLVLKILNYGGPWGFACRLLQNN
jgi:hypothetical protein